MSTITWAGIPPLRQRYGCNYIIYGTADVLQLANKYRFNQSGEIVMYEILSPVEMTFYHPGHEWAVSPNYFIVAT